MTKAHSYHTTGFLKFNIKAFMKNSTNSLTQAKLKELLHYDPITGVFTWIRRTSNRIKIGDTANGKNTRGYILIAICGKRYYAHRLAHLYMTGKFPVSDVDHANGVKDCNSWTNLRKCTASQNQFNTGVRKDNTSGCKGVSLDNARSKWKAQAKINGKQKTIGYYANTELASKERQSFAKLHHGEFYRRTI